MKNWQNACKNKKFVASYSGGKDSTLALYKAIQMGGVPVALLSMVREEDGYVGSHGVSLEIIQAQAQAMGIPLLHFSTTWQAYGPNLLQALAQAQELGAEVLVTGDLDLPEEGCWYDHIAEKSGLAYCAPLWRYGHRQAVEEFLQAEFTTMLTAINEKMGLLPQDLGRILDWSYMAELEGRSIDPCGEAGEFHSIVLGGPNFKYPLQVKKAGTHLCGGNLCLKLEIEQ